MVKDSQRPAGGTWPRVEYPRLQEALPQMTHSKEGTPEPAGKNGMGLRLVGEDLLLTRVCNETADSTQVTFSAASATSALAGSQSA